MGPHGLPPTWREGVGEVAAVSSKASDKPFPGQLKIRGCVNSGFFRFFCRLSADGVGQFCSLGLDRGAEFCLIPCFDVLTDTYVIASRMTGGVVTPNRAAQMRIKLVKPLRL